MNESTSTKIKYRINLELLLPTLSYPCRSYRYHQEDRMISIRIHHVLFIVVTECIKFCIDLFSEVCHEVQLVQQEVPRLNYEVEWLK